MFRFLWLHKLLGISSRSARRRQTVQKRRIVRLQLERLEDRVTPTANLYVDPSGVATGGQAAYTTIQAAVNAAPAGSTIIVDPGSYSENVTINQQGITLDGAQAGINPIPGRSGPESILNGTITITAANVTIDGFTVNAASQ